MRTDLPFESKSFGQTEDGISLQYISGRMPCELLVIAGVHGEEPETTVTLSRALRRLQSSPSATVVLAANPSGLIHGTRGNINGVDLNRNFPTSNWQEEPVKVRWHSDDDDTAISIGTGKCPGSELETTAMIGLIEKLNPQLILSLHAPLACIDDPQSSELGNWLSLQTGLPLVSEIGYPVPGSMGSWAAETGRHLVTWEFPKASVEELSDELGYVDVLCEIFKKYS